ncbi:MAG: precorrin-3B C(17)-methyltransferase [Desulfonatronovibrionaceae bacterium]
MAAGKYSDCKGKLYVVGVGPGNPLDRTKRAERAIQRSSTVVGYPRYIEHVRELVTDKKIVSSGMTRERERCAEAVRLATQGEVVSLVSSGDAGIYGMAGLALEMLEKEGVALDVDVIPGVSASQALAAKVGAPLMIDHAVISLSDILVPWERIEIRLKAVAAADLVCALYNPKSKKRIWQLSRAREIFLEYRDPDSPVAVGTDVSLPSEGMILSTLHDFPIHEVNMRSCVIVGNSDTKLFRKWLVTPRGYYEPDEDL